MSRAYFGTDGIRGTVGEGPITPRFAVKLGWALGKVLKDSMDTERRISVLIGKDTRISGYMFESALEAGLVAAGVDVMLLGPMPTPAIAYLARAFRCDAGVVISASHNPYQDNGIKFFSATGAKLEDHVELAIESHIAKDMTTVSSANLGKVTRVNDAGGRYIEFCKSTFPNNLSLRGVKMVVDCAHGATYQVAPAVLEELGAEVIAMGVSPDGLNINAGVGSTSPEAMREKVLEVGADLGVAFDGDGDRVAFVDHLGELLDGDELLYIIASEQLRAGEHCPGVVGTLMSNLGFELAIKELGLSFARANVGDRYVNELMKKHQWMLGGESSGHIICADVTTTGDGPVAALKVLQAVVGRGVPLYELKRGMSKFPQKMINVRVADKSSIAAHPDVKYGVDQVEQELGSKGRVLLRPSGTEPLVRVMVEGEDGAQVDRLAARLAEIVEKAVA